MGRIAVAVLGFAVTGCGGALVNDDLFDAGKDAASDGTVVDVVGGDAGSDAGPDVVAIDAGADACQTTTCSDDLLSVIDCNGNVVSTCPSGQGCKAGACVPACEAAAARPSNVGCDFYAVDPDVLTGFGLEGSCYAVSIVNSWSTPATITVDRAGMSLSAASFGRIVQGNGKTTTYAPLTNGTVPPGSTAILFLAKANNGSTNCPAGITPAVVADPAVHGTGLGSAFHIATTAPVTAADFAPFGGVASGVGNETMLYPTNAWNTNYMVVDAYVASAITAATPSTDIVALEDGTQVTIRPVAQILGGGGVAPAAFDTSTTYALSKGQVLQFSQAGDLTGSPIESNKPVGVWGAHLCMNIDPNVGFCDSGHQQLAPVSALGSEYAAGRYRGRDGSDETPPWRIVGVADGTTLTWDPSTPPGAPTTLAAKQLVTFKAAGPFSVRSQDASHPFYMSAHMSGGSAFTSLGDPEFVNVIPVAQWRTSYAFYADHTFPQHNLVFVRRKGPSGFADVTLDCLGKIGNWTPIGAGGTYELARVDLSVGEFMAQGSCDSGMRTVKSTAPFSVTAWGWGTATTGPNTSFAITGGALAGALHGVVLSAK